LEPQHLRFGGGTTETVLNPIVLALVLLVGILVLALPRAKVIAPLIAAFILIPMDQILLIGGMHFPMLRFLALFGIARLAWENFTSRRIFSGGINKIDIAVVSFAIVTALAGVLLFREWGALVYQLGNVYTICGIYFLLRYLLRDERDVIRMLRALAYVAAVAAIVMTWEMITGRNPYALLGGADAAIHATSMARADRFRATGGFAHPILAGTFGAILVPLFVLLWQDDRKNRIIAAVGIISATIITLASNSSTPILAYAAGVLALCMWPARNRMRAIRWAVVIVMVSLHMVMKAPVWHLIARIDLSGGSSSYHRFMVVDQCIRHFSDWWLVGVKSTYEWGWDMWDTANQYVSICDCSGLVPFVLFLAAIVYGFQYLGRARKAAGSRREQIFLWGLGSALFANVVAFMGISYVDQTQVVWYGLLAGISAAAIVQPQSETAQVQVLMSAQDTIAQVDFDSGREKDRIHTDPVTYPARQRSLVP